MADYTKIRRSITGYKCLILHELQNIDTDFLTDAELDLAGLLMRSGDVKKLLEEAREKGYPINLI